MNTSAEKRVVFRCDASVRLGGGHVSRCLALARAFIRDGWQSGFAVNNEALEVMPALKDLDFCIVSEGTENQAMRQWRPEGCDLLVVDHYGLDRDFESSIRGWATRVLVVDDLADRPHDADLLLDQTLGRDARDYSGLVPEDCTILAGPRFALLRDQFRQLRPKALSRPLDRPCRRLLIACGLGDHLGLTLTTLRAIALQADDTLSVDVIVGGDCPSLPEIRDLANEMPQTVRVMTDVQDVAGLMLEADLCVGAAGTSSWERGAMALPTLYYIAVANQDLVAAALAASGAGVSLGRPGELSDPEIGTRIRALVQDSSRRASMAASAARICDGRGTGRVLNATSPLHTRSDDAISLRNADKDDMAEVFTWQSDPESRRYSRNPETPDWAEHSAWWKRRFALPDPALEIVTCNGSPAGLVRLDPDPEGYEVSILVAPGYRGRGIGGAALRLLRRLEPDAALIAFIHPDNKSSIALFENAGYVAAGNGRLISNGTTVD